MARRPPRGAALAVLALSALVPVAACSSGTPSSGEVTHAPSAGTSGQSAPAVSAPPSTITFGPFTEDFATALPSDPAQLKVIADWREAMIFWDKSSEDEAMESPVSSYATGSAVNTLKGVLSNEASRHFIPAGVDTLFSTRATVAGNNHATVVSCDDGSQYTIKDTQTGTVSTPAPPNEDYVQVTWEMTMVAGHWAMSSVTVVDLPAAAAKSCQATAPPVGGP
jgi:hypothetical protein